MRPLKPEHRPPAIGARLRLTRDALGLNQTVFAERAGIAVSTYNQWEKGERYPSPEGFTALAEQYHLTTDWILMGEISGLRYETAEAIKALRASRSAN